MGFWSQNHFTLILSNIEHRKGNFFDTMCYLWLIWSDVSKDRQRGSTFYRGMKGKKKWKFDDSTPARICPCSTCNPNLDTKCKRRAELLAADRNALRFVPLRSTRAECLR